MPITDYTINGDAGTQNLNAKVNKTQQDLYEKNLINYGIATVIQYVLAIHAVFSFISGQVAFYNDNMDKWFSRNTVFVLCIAFIGVIAAVKSLFKHEPCHDEIEIETNNSLTKRS